MTAARWRWAVAAALMVPAVVAAQPGPAAPAVTGQSAGPLRPADLLEDADAALQGGRWVEAEALLHRYAEQATDADRAAASLLNAELLIATGHPGDALAILRTAGAADRNPCRFAAAQGSALLLTGAPVEADHALQTMSSACQADPAYWRAAGNVALELRQPAGAVAAFRRALGLEPQSSVISNDLAVALLAAGRPLEAVNLLAPLLGRNPEDPELRVNLDFALGMLGRSPARMPSDSDDFWSRRLQFAGAGARQTGRLTLAQSLIGQAVKERPRYDADLWQQYSELVGR